MAKGINKHIVIGTVGQDPDIKYAANGNAIANLSLAVNETWKDKNTGEKQERTDWIRVVIFGKLAEICGQYVQKGSQLYIEGKVKTRKYQDPNTGQDRYVTETVVDYGGVMQMLGGKQDGGQSIVNQQANAYGAAQSQNQQQTGGQQAPQNNQKMNQQSQQQQPPQYTPNDFDDDDVPFRWQDKWPELFTLA